LKRKKSKFTTFDVIECDHDLSSMHWILLSIDSASSHQPFSVADHCSVSIWTALLRFLCQAQHTDLVRKFQQVRCHRCLCVDT